MQHSMVESIAITLDTGASYGCFDDAMSWIVNVNVIASVIVIASVLWFRLWLWLWLWLWLLVFSWHACRYRQYQCC
jgi:lipoprotein signal peptidase